MVDDRDAFEELKAVSNIGARHLVRHYLYFPSERTAKSVANQLRDKGLEVEGRLGADGTNWLVLAKVEMVPTQEAILNMRASLEAIAGENAGEYDGWEAEVQPNNP
ncbi:ribonuclease E inhibitor RraB [Planctomycetota bacterium]